MALFSVLGIKGGYSEVLCIHYKEGVAHIEKEHPSLPADEDEIHIKLIPDASLKICKESSDSFTILTGNSFLLFFKNVIKMPLPKEKIPLRKSFEPIKTVRLII